MKLSKGAVAGRLHVVVLTTVTVAVAVEGCASGHSAGRALSTVSPSPANITPSTQLSGEPSAPVLVSSAGPSIASALASTTSPAGTPAGPCDPNLLAMTFRGGTDGGGNDFGDLVILVRSGPACAITGPGSLQGLDSMGRPDASIATMPVVVSDGATLSASTKLALPISGGTRDDPQTPGVVCSAAHEVTPQSWRLTLPNAALVATNTDLGTPGAPPDVKHLSACRGLFTVQDTVHAEP
jgi:hypothetical protein